MSDAVEQLREEYEAKFQCMKKFTVETLKDIDERNLKQFENLSQEVTQLEGRLNEALSMSGKMCPTTCTSFHVYCLRQMLQV